MRIENRVLGVVISLCVALWTAFMCCFVIFFGLLKTRWGQRVVIFWGKGCLLIFGVKLRYTGLEKIKAIEGQGMILTPNHASALDIMVVAALPICLRWISKIEVAYVPLLGWAGWASGMLFVRRNKDTKDVKIIMKSVEEGVKKGDTIIMFPEGTRTRTGALLPLKKGPFRVAQNTGVPVIPMALIGTYDFAPPLSFPRHWGHEVTLRIGDPMQILPNEPLEKEMARFKQKLIALLEAGPLA